MLFAGLSQGTSCSLICCVWYLTDLCTPFFIQEEEYEF